MVRRQVLAPGRGTPTPEFAMWPAAPAVEGGRPLAARWPRAAVLACAWCAAGYLLLLVAPQAILTRWTAVPRTAREVAAALWFAAGFVALVAVLVRAQRPPARPHEEPHP